jgi:hypothetical protein
MNDGYAWWLVIVGVAIGIALVWLVIVRLPRAEDDVDEDERLIEAGWISRTIEAWGGVAPAALVDEVLELHQSYLASGGSTPAVELGAAERFERERGTAVDVAAEAGGLGTAPGEAADLGSSTPRDG